MIEAPLYNPEPKEPDPLQVTADFWRTATWMLATFSLFIGGTLGFALGNTYTRDGQQAELDAKHWKELAEGCRGAFNELAFDATLALVYTLDTQEALRSFLGQHPQPSVEYTASETWSGR